MNNGRFIASCGTPNNINASYATTDAEQEAIDLLLADDSESEKIEGYAPVGEISLSKTICSAKDETLLRIASRE